MSDRMLHDGLSTDSSSSPGLRLVGGGSDREIQRAIDISVIGAAGAGAATFLPILPELPEDDLRAAPDRESRGRSDALARAWDDWLGQRFEAGLAEPFCRIHDAAGRMRLGEIARADERIDCLLSDDERARSLSAARAFREGRDSVRHMPQWTRLEQAIDRGEAAGHVTTLFAVQAGLYHLPRLPALISYAYFEWLGGVVAAGWTGPTVVPAFEAGHPQTFACLRRILQRGIEDSEGGESSIFSVD